MSLSHCLETANATIEQHALDYAITELRFGGRSGFDLIRSISDRHPQCRIIVHTAYCDLGVAVHAVKSGAADVCPKPMDADHFIGILLQKCKETSPQLHDLEPPDQVRAEHIRQVFLSCGSNMSRTAKHLSLQRRTLQRMMARQPSLRASGE